MMSVSVLCEMPHHVWFYFFLHPNQQQWKVVGSNQQHLSESLQDEQLFEPADALKPLMALAVFTRTASEYMQINAACVSQYLLDPAAQPAVHALVTLTQSSSNNNCCCWKHCRHLLTGSMVHSQEADGSPTEKQRLCSSFTPLCGERRSLCRWRCRDRLCVNPNYCHQRTWRDPFRTRCRCSHEDFCS